MYDVRQRTWISGVTFALLTLIVTACGAGGLGSESTSTPTVGVTASTAGTPTSAAPATTIEVVETVDGPVARGYHEMVALGGLGVMLQGGQTASPPAGGQVLDDTWSYTKSTGWVMLGTGAPWGHASAYDAQSNQAIAIVEPGATWVYDPVASAWSKQESSGPILGRGARAAYDAESDRTILFTTGGQTWAYDLDTDTWTQMNPATAPSRRAWHMMAYDQDSDRVVLFGGDPDWGDTWAYDYNSDMWTEMTPVTGPEARFYSAMAYEPVSDRIILFGGVTSSFEEPIIGDTWAYDFDTNTWTELHPPSAPSARGWHAMAYDEVDRVVVLFSGGLTRDDVIFETWLFDPADDTWKLAP